MPILFLLNKIAAGDDEFGGMVPFMPAIRPRNPKYFSIGGITKDNTGAVLANCVVNLFRSDNNVLVDSLISGADGSFNFTTAGPGEFYYEVAYKAGAPDVAGTTTNTLIGV